MSRTRTLFLGAILVGSCLLGWLIYSSQQETVFKSSFAPVLQIAGRTTSSVNKALSKVIPVNDMDEAQYGEAVAMRYAANSDDSSPEHEYLNDLVQYLAGYSRKPFDYQVFVLEYDYVNAFALPGGVILVTRGLIDAMDCESELAAVLAHEMGHIEREHCLRAVKYELLFRKLHAPALGELADLAMNLMIRHSFSKTEENEADEYAFQLLKQSRYDPRGVGDAFRHLDASHGGAQTGTRANLMRDYFTSHPPLPLRIERFTEDAEAWWRSNPRERRYSGERNLRQRKCACNILFQNEMVDWEHPRHFR